MSRRVRVPGTDELFRPTAVPATQQGAQAVAAEPQVVELAEAKQAKGSGPAVVPADPGRTASGRVKHDEKMTVYVTSDELFDLEQARLDLRRGHGLAVDRGRLVRAAIAMALADLDEHGANSAFLRRLDEC